MSWTSPQLAAVPSGSRQDWCCGLLEGVLPSTLAWQNLDRNWHDGVILTRIVSGVRHEAAMYRDRIHFLFLNIGHFLDHMFTLIFATVAALALTRACGLRYGDLFKYATP